MDSDQNIWKENLNSIPTGKSHGFCLQFLSGPLSLERHFSVTNKIPYALFDCSRYSIEYRVYLSQSYETHFLSFCTPCKSSLAVMMIDFYQQKHETLAPFTYTQQCTCKT